MGCPVKNILPMIAGVTIHLLAGRLRQLRLRHGLTQEQFAEAAGIGYKFYQQIESGRKKQLWLETLDRLAAGFGLEAWQLLGSELPAESKVVMRPATKNGRTSGTGPATAQELPVQSADQKLAVAEPPKDKYSIRRRASRRRKSKG